VAGISDLPSVLGPVAKAKFVFLGSSVSSNRLMDQVRSLNLEHVSPGRHLPRSEISRRATTVAADEAHLLARMRRWFFTRKPDAGFVLTDFPATLLQAKVLDEWLEARDEVLTAVVGSIGANPAVIDHYQTLGLLWEPGALAKA